MLVRHVAAARPLCDKPLREAWTAPAAEMQSAWTVERKPAEDVTSRAACNARTAAPGKRTGGRVAPVFPRTTLGGGASARTVDMREQVQTMLRNLPEPGKPSHSLLPSRTNRSCSLRRLQPAQSSSSSATDADAAHNLRKHINDMDALIARA